MKQERSIFEGEKIPATLLFLIVLIVLILLIKPYDLTGFSQLTGHTIAGSPAQQTDQAQDPIVGLLPFEQVREEYDKAEAFVNTIIQRSENYEIDGFISVAVLFDKKGYFSLDEREIDQLLDSFNMYYDHFYAIHQDHNFAMIDSLYSHFAGFEQVKRSQIYLDTNYTYYALGLSDPQGMTDSVTRVYIYASLFKDLVDDRRIRSIEDYQVAIWAMYGFDPTFVDYISPFVADARYAYHFLQRYSFDDYSAMQQGAEFLLERCTDLRNLQRCITETLEIFNQDPDIPQPHPAESSAHYAAYLAISEERSLTWNHGDTCFDLDHEQRFFSQLDSIQRCAGSLSSMCACQIQGLEEVELQGQSYSPTLRLVNGITQITTHAQIAGFRQHHTLFDVGLTQPELILTQEGITTPDFAGQKLGKIQEGYLGPIDTDEFCILQPQTTFIFCVETDDKVHVFDDMSGRYRQKPVVYRFALTFVPDTSKPPSFGELSVHTNTDDDRDYLMITSEVPFEYGSSSERTLISKVGGVIR